MTHYVIFQFIYYFIFLFVSVVTEKNMKVLFNTYKSKYNREYLSPLSEKKAFLNFVNNVKLVDELNNKTRSKDVPFLLNRYADLDPQEVEEHFAIHVKPYDQVLHDENGRIVRTKKQRFLEDMNLHDLVKVDNLYQDWMQKWGKKNETKKLQRAIHYYRFIKTVADINKKKFDGEDVSLGADADVVLEPEKYFYG